MENSAEFLRMLGNIAQIGTVVETKSEDGLALARVSIFGRVSDFLPVLGFGNDFVRIWLPVRVQQQVIVISPFGEAASGVIIPSIFNKSCKEPDGASDQNAIVEFSGGVKIQSDGVDIEIVCASANIKADSVNINADVAIDGDLVVSGTITDAKGDLTNHTHDTTDGAVAKVR